MLLEKYQNNPKTSFAIQKELKLKGKFWCEFAFLNEIKGFFVCLNAQSHNNYLNNSNQTFRRDKHLIKPDIGKD